MTFVSNKSIHFSFPVKRPYSVTHLRMEVFGYPPPPFSGNKWKKGLFKILLGNLYVDTFNVAVDTQSTLQTHQLRSPTLPALYISSFIAATEFPRFIWNAEKNARPVTRTVADSVLEHGRTTPHCAPWTISGVRFWPSLSFFSRTNCPTTPTTLRSRRTLWAKHFCVFHTFHNVLEIRRSRKKRILIYKCILWLFKGVRFLWFLLKLFSNTQDAENVIAGTLATRK